MKREVSVVVLDLDDTLWDWVNLWYHPFRALLTKVAEESKIPEDILIKDFKEVFSRHGTTEYSFALQELSSIKNKYSHDQIPIIFREAIDAFRDARRNSLALYPDVQDTLDKIKDKGSLIIGYTESLAFYTRYRLIHLGLDRVLDYLYSPADHDLPEGLTAENIRHFDAEHYQLRRTIHHHTPKGKNKPSPEVLLKIIEDVGANPGEAIYVGDKLVKDVSMAQAAGVVDVHAKYGEAHNREEYELLRKVTHWSDKDVQRERETTANDVNPSYTLKSFRELLDNFTFTPFVDRSEKKMSIVVDAWKKTIDVQQHFNEIEMKIRNHVITLFVAICGAAGVAVKEGLPVLAVMLTLIGVIGVALFGMMDGLWYHQLLRGAVKHACAIEKRFFKNFSELSLSHAIGKASPINIWGRQIHSTAKLWIFYGGLSALLLLAAAICPFIKIADKSTLKEENKNATNSVTLKMDSPIFVTGNVTNLLKISLGN